MDAKQRSFASIDAMRHQVAHVLDHQSFSRSRGPARLLKHLADRLACNGGLPVTQTELAKVLKLPSDFDPSSNPLVRMHMSKLRRMLARYAAGDGRNDEVVLELPCNSYQLRAYASPTQLAAVGEGALNGNDIAVAFLRSLVLVSEFVSPAEPALGAALARSLASLLVAGLPLVQCLEALQDQTEDQVFRIVIRDVRLDISAGNSFSSAVKKFPNSFPNLFTSMVEAGEASGGLAEILGKVAGYFEATVKLSKKVKSAMTSLLKTSWVCGVAS
jgi:hypothetical protein